MTDPVEVIKVFVERMGLHGASVDFAQNLIMTSSGGSLLSEIMDYAPADRNDDELSAIANRMSPHEDVKS
jgi:hypothetical protein